AVAPTGLVLGFVHGVHLSRLVDTIVAAYVVNLKGGMTVRLQESGASPGIRCTASALLEEPPS
ncbi:MAG: hypothetical protein WCZ20_00750, partial [Hydrogenophaga sp.]